MNYSHPCPRMTVIGLMVVKSECLTNEVSSIRLLRCIFFYREEPAMRPVRAAVAVLNLCLMSAWDRGCIQSAGYCMDVKRHRGESSIESKY